MSNKYLIKISQEEVLENPNHLRMAGKAALFGVLGGIPLVGMGLGIHHGITSSTANQLKEQKLRNAALQKHAAETVGKSRLNELVDPDWGRALGKATVQGGGLALLGNALGKTIGPRSQVFGSAFGAGLGTVSGLKSSFKNQLREQDVHNIKLLGAKERHEMHQARMQKMAQLVSDQVKKDVVGTGTIAALGGVGNVIADKIVHGAKAPAGHMGKTFLVGTGIGLAADFAGLKLSNAYNKHVDGQVKQSEEMLKSAELLEKIALNAMARNIGKMPNLSMASGNAMEGMSAASNAAKAKAMAGGKDPMVASLAASSQASRQVGSSTLTKSVSSGGSDVLATSSIQDRLAARRSSLGLSAANGDKVKQIENANAIRVGKASGRIGGELKASGSGTSGSMNAQKINQALVDAKAGNKAHLTVDSLSKNISSVSTAIHPTGAPVKPVASGGILNKARGLLKSPLGKKLAIGGGLLGAGALAHKVLSKPSEPQYM